MNRSCLEQLIFSREEKDHSVLSEKSKLGLSISNYPKCYGTYSK